LNNSNGQNLLKDLPWQHIQYWPTTISPLFFSCLSSEMQRKEIKLQEKPEDKNKIKINLVFVLLYCAFSVCFVYPFVFLCFMFCPCIVVCC
jgi:hypothetical protein